MSNKNSPNNNMPDLFSTESNDRNLMTGVLIGGLFGVAVGAVATLMARLFMGAAGQFIRKVIFRDKFGKSFDPRWLMQ